MFTGEPMKISLSCFLALFLGTTLHSSTSFVFVIASYNNESFVWANLESIFAQDYSNYRILYCDDASTDKTEEQVIACCTQHNKLDKLTYIKNPINRKALYSIYNAIHYYCSDTDVILLLDGDDWLVLDPTILKQLDSIYQNPNVWATYGEFFSLHANDGSHSVTPYSNEMLQEKTCRYNYFYFTHMRTFYAGLFKKIKIVDFLDNNDFFHYAWDLPIAFPILEMATEHVYYNNVVIYVYNNILTTNDHALNQRKQIYFDFLTRNKKKYKTINTFEKNKFTNIGHISCINTSNNNELCTKQIASINIICNIQHTITCLNNNNNLLHSDFFKANNIFSIQNCTSSSCLSKSDIEIIRGNIYNAIVDAPVDYFMITKTDSPIPSLQYYQPEILSLADITVIGKTILPLTTLGLNRVYPEVGFINLNQLGMYLNYQEPSAIIVSKEKLLTCFEKEAWVNGSYLSFLALISSVHGAEHIAFILTN